MLESNSKYFGVHPHISRHLVETGIGMLLGLASVLRLSKLKEYIAYGVGATVLVALLYFKPGHTIAAFLILVFLITERDPNWRRPFLMRPFLKNLQPQKQTGNEMESTEVSNEKQQSVAK